MWSHQRDTVLKCNSFVWQAKALLTQGHYYFLPYAWVQLDREESRCMSGCSQQMQRFILPGQKTIADNKTHYSISPASRRLAAEKFLQGFVTDFFYF